METIIRYEFYTGLSDTGNVHEGDAAKPVEDYAKLLQGLPHAIITKPPDINKFDPPEPKGSGERFEYSVLKAYAPRRILLPYNQTTYQDNSHIETNFIYNEKLQLRETAWFQYEFSNGTKKIDIPQKKSKINTYYWEADPAQTAAQNRDFAPALLFMQTEAIAYETENHHTLKQFIYKKRYSYLSRTGASGFNRFYLQMEEKGDGLDYSQWLPVKQLIYTDEMDGRIRRIETSKLTPTDAGDITKLQYSRSSSLITASFQRMSPGSSNGDAHCLNFENYVDNYQKANITNQNLTSLAFTMNNVNFVDEGFLAKRSIKVIGDSQLKITNAFDVRAAPGKFYIFSCYRRETIDTNYSNWMYFQRRINSQALKDSRVVHNFAANQYLCHITLREEKTIATLNVYDPDTMLLSASIDNFGVPTIYRYDVLNRMQLSYTGQIERKTLSITELYYDITGKAAIHPIAFSGYSRFRGYNCSTAPVGEDSPWNADHSFVFPEEGTFLPRTAGKLTGLSTNTLFASGLWLTSDQILTIKKASYTVKVTMLNNVAKLAINDTVVQTSQAYLPDKSSWAVLVIGAQIGVIVNGKLILSYIHTEASTITEVSTGAVASTTVGGSLLSDILVATKVMVQSAYYDYMGNTIQTQSIRDGRALVSQTFYDRRGNAVLKTAPAYYPVAGKKLATSDKPLTFRTQFAKMDFQPGGKMTGEIIEFYNSTEGQKYTELPDDKKRPYATVEYEVSATNRVTERDYVGEVGHELTDINYYHDRDSVDAFSDFTYNNSGNFAYNLKQITRGSNDYHISSHRLFNIMNLQYVNRRIGFSDTPTQPIQNSTWTNISASGLLEFSPTVTSFVKKYYLNDDITTPRVEEQRFAANRKQIIKGRNFDERVAYFDSVGNQRLFRNATMGTWQYARYDAHRRILESGLFVPNDPQLDANFADRVNQAGYPTTADGRITPIFRYTYDSYADAIDDFRLGRLTSVQNLVDTIEIRYSYDYLGRTSTFTMKKTSFPIVFEKVVKYTFDCLGNEKSIVYPVDSAYSLFYTYNDYAQVTKIETKKGTAAAVTVLQNAKYDLFDQLASYEQSNNFSVVREQTLQGHTRYAGPPDKIEMPLKTYLGHWDPDALVAIDVKQKDSTVISRTLEYAPNGELKNTTYKKGAATVKTDATYDGSGNITALSANGQTLNYSYKFDHLESVKKPDGTTVASMGYGSDGSMRSATTEDGSYTFTQDDMYNEKVKQIQLTGAKARNNYMTYDSMGNMLAETHQKLLYKIYIYGAGNQLAYQYVNGRNFSSNYIYIYCGDLLVSQLDVRTDKLIHLVYDSMNTLVMEKDTEARPGDPLALLFGVPAPAHTGKDITFHYAGMYYMEKFKLYEDQGALYFPQFGVTSSPSLGPDARFYTPYRKFGNRPLQ